MNSTGLNKLGTYIEEILRASSSSSATFIDSRRYRERLVAKQNHVVFGRRGAGKTSLVSSVNDAEDFVVVYLNLEDYKDITFPKIVIQILVELFLVLEGKVAGTYRWFELWRRPARKLRKGMCCTRSILRDYLHEPDVETQEVSEKDSCGQEIEVSTGKKILNLVAKKKKDRAREVKRSLPKNKMEYLRVELTSYKRLIRSVSDLLGAKPIYLVMDDFYFIPKETQPEFIDYFHRLTKDTSLFLKIATIKHRSKLYQRRLDQYVGVELGHDIFEVDMDYTLDNFDELRSFMKQLLESAIRVSSADVQVDEMFAGDGFSQLCLASGGVPRDFLSLFVKLANGASHSGAPIGKVLVNDAAISSVASKLESMKKDSGKDDCVLESCLKNMKDFVYREKRTNAFLIAKDDLEGDPTGRQAIRELVDLRLIHLIDHNTSKAPSDGRRYEAYILDIGLYDNSRPRNFSQVDPGQRDDKARKDDVRAAPVFSLSKFWDNLPGATESALSQSFE